MKSLFCFITVLGLLACELRPAQAKPDPSAGIAFHVLRVIYAEADKLGVTLTASNNSPTPFLMQSWIRPVDPDTGDVDLRWHGSPVMPFIVTPPLARTEPDGELVVRIRRNDVPLPRDRESVFFVSMKALPAQQKDQKQVVITVVSNLKLFYRPAGLSKRAVADMAPRLTFSREGNRLTANNPTPYWLTFSRLQVGSVTLEKPALRLMVPPFGSRTYVLPSAASGQVSWQLIDEDGWDTPVARQD